MYRNSNTEKKVWGEKTVVSDLFDAEDIKKAIKETNFEKAIGEDWFVGNLLNDDKISTNLIGQMVQMVNT